VEGLYEIIKDENDNTVYKNGKAVRDDRKIDMALEIMKENKLEAYFMQKT